MKRVLCLAAPALLSLASFAQAPCGGVPGVDVTVTPAVAAVGQPIVVTIDNQSSQTITLPSSCVFTSVDAGATCIGPSVLNLFCLQVLTPIAPGQSRQQSWDQLDDFGQQVAPGAYSFPILYYDGSFQQHSCCVTVTISSGPNTYCTAGTTSSGCVPAISADNQPSVSAANPCNISVANVEGQRSGLIFYGVSGPQAAPWAPQSSSFLCVKSPTQRTPAQSSGGTNGACDGSLALDWNAYQAANPTALGNPWAAGDMAWVQGWFRDPPAPKTTNLTDAVELLYIP